jgi:predicted DNA-binding transcriptional regulator YafY
MRHDKAAQLLELARRLASSAEGLTLDEMAEAAGVGRRTAERMRDALYVLFPKLEETADGATKRFRIPRGLDAFFQDPTTEELAELSMAAAALRAVGAEPRAEVLASLERKIRSAMRTQSWRRVAPDVEALVRAEAIAVQAGPHPFEDLEVMGLIRQALLAMKALRFRYAGGRTPGRPRTVTPYGLMFGRANYLVAADQGSTEPRTWRLDRMRDLEVLDAPAAAPESFSLQDFANRSFGIYQDQVEDVVLEIAPERAEDALSWRFHPSQSVEPQADGSVVVRFRASGMRELAWHLFTWGTDVTVRAPDALRDTLTGELRAALDWHGAGRAARRSASPPIR